MFGTILTDLQAGALKNSNSVSSSTPDDVSLALGFDIGSLAVGHTATLTFRIATTDIGVLLQVDPESGNKLYLNGYATVSELSGPGPEIPEPSTITLIGAGLAAVALQCRSSAATKIRK